MPSKKPKQCMAEEDMIPGMPEDIALMCLSRLPQRARARCMCVSRAFRKALSNKKLLDKVCEQQGISSKQMLIFICLGRRDETNVTDESEEEDDDDDDDDDEEDWGVMYKDLVWLVLDPFTGTWEVLCHLPPFGPNAVCRSIKLAAGHHPGQVLIHGLVRNSDNWRGCPSPQESQIWCYNLLSRKMFSCTFARICRTDFAWARCKDELYIAAGRSYPIFDGVFLYDAMRYNLAKYANDVFENNHHSGGFSNVATISNVDEQNTRVNYNHSGGFRSVATMSYGDLQKSNIRESYYYGADYDYDDDNDVVLTDLLPIANINVPRRLCTAFTWGPGLYLLGGVSEDGEPITSGEFYDPDFGAWFYVKNMWPFDDGEPPNVAVVSDRIYGIKPMTTEIIRFEGLANRWVTFANLPNNCSAFEQHWLLGVGDELWVLVNHSIDKTFSVLSCEPRKTLYRSCCKSGESIVNWKKSFRDLPSGFHILDATVIEV